jgi:hypothetical protein
MKRKYVLGEKKDKSSLIRIQLNDYKSIKAWIHLQSESTPARPKGIHNVFLGQLQTTKKLGNSGKA